MTRTGLATRVVALALLLGAAVVLSGVTESEANLEIEQQVVSQPTPLAAEPFLPQILVSADPPATLWNQPSLPEFEPAHALEAPSREANVQADPHWNRIRAALGEADEQPALLTAADRSLPAQDGGALFEEEEAEAGERNGYWAWESPPGRFTQLDVGMFHNCALREDGSAFCWGEQNPPHGYSTSEDDGQLDAPEGRFVQVSAGHSHSCGLREDCSVVCWGAEDFYYSGIVDDKITVFVEQPPGEFTKINAGNEWTCGLRADGNVDCWGGVPSTLGVDPPVLASPPGSFLQVAVPDSYPEFCGLTTDGRVRCWWDGAYYITELSGGPFVQLSVGGPQICGLRADGRAVCVFAHISDDPWTVATPSESFVQISVGGSVVGGPDSANGCGIRPDGRLSCWGERYPWLLESPEGRFSYVGVGHHHACALREDGTIECWGDQSAD